jgi:hypothetical protein
MKNVFFENRLLRINANMLVKNLGGDDLKIYEEVEGFLLDYCNFYSLNMQNVFNTIVKFQSRYNLDVKNYLNTGKYPFELNNDYEISRQDYDIVLISSILLSSHRFEIMKLIKNINLMGSVAVVGIGPGIELKFLEGVDLDIEAYDLNISEFSKNKFEHISTYKKKFSSKDKKYNVIIAIELLEHLEDPFILIKDIYNSLNDGGRFVFTTTTNVPQFDHLYDFDIDILDFEIDKIGFKILQKKKIAHMSRFDNIDAYNTFYIVEK